jgi:hypothetical protein
MAAAARRVVASGQERIGSAVPMVLATATNGRVTTTHAKHMAAHISTKCATKLTTALELL